MYGVHSGEVFVKELARTDVVCNLFFAGECPFKLFVKLGFLRNLLHTFSDSVERGLCREGCRNCRRAEHFAVNTVLTMCKECVRICELCRSFGVACLRITESVRSDSRAYPFNVTVEVCRKFSLRAGTELHKRFALCRATVRKIVEPELARVINRVALAVFFKEEEVEDCVSYIVVDGNLVDVLKNVFRSLVDLIMNFFGLVGACPVVDGGILHIAFHSECLHIRHLVKLDGNSEHAACKSADNGTLHTVKKIRDGLFAVFRAFGAQSEYFIQRVGLNFRMLICVHSVYFLYINKIYTYT